ncbi:MAG TPA: MFS transporter [Usitatibacter sp.]|nr:MFS transporter [Usitatibacter sp.]
MSRFVVLVFAVGVAQLISWGTLFYAVGVLGAPMGAELGMSELFVFGAFTAALVVSGSLAPWAGKLLDRRGGRFVMSIGSLLGAAGMALLATAAHPVQVVVGWVVVGAAMATSLYDPAFAALSQFMAGTPYRRAVTALTILGGLASTVFWPVSQLLMDAWSWRVAFGVHAALHLFVCLPVHMFLLPNKVEEGPATSMRTTAATAEASPPRPGMPWLTLAVAVGSFVSALVAVHVVSLLTASGLTQSQAIWIAMLIGPMQVAGRIAEFGFAARVGVIALGHLAFALLVVATVALMLVDGLGLAAFIFVAAYGWGNGIFTIIRGTTPVELWGRRGLGAVLGHLSRAGQYSRAVAPASFSGMLAIGLGRHATLAILAAFGVGALASYARAVRIARKAPRERDAA